MLFMVRGCIQEVNKACHCTLNPTNYETTSTLFRLLAFKVLHGGVIVKRRKKFSRKRAPNKPTAFPSFKTSGLVHDYRFHSAKWPRIAAPGEAAGARLLSGSRFDDWRSCADSVLPGRRRQAEELSCCVPNGYLPTLQCLHPRQALIPRLLRSIVPQTAVHFRCCQMESLACTSSGVLGGKLHWEGDPHVWKRTGGRQKMVAYEFYSRDEKGRKHQFSF